MTQDIVIKDHRFNCNKKGLSIHLEYSHDIIICTVITLLEHYNPDPDLQVPKHQTSQKLC